MNRYGLSPDLIDAQNWGPDPGKSFEHGSSIGNEMNIRMLLREGSPNVPESLHVRQLYRLYYRSRQTPSIIPDLDVVVQHIVKSSIRNNKDDGLTGLLVTIQDSFIQTLEGPVDSVRNTYARISCDRRHRDPQIIAQGPVEKRLFSDWNMCARSLAVSDKAILDVISAKGNFNPAALTPQSVHDLLTTVAKIQRRIALGALATQG